MLFSSPEFLFVSGKGGVGKTTVAAALAKALAQRGRRVLLALTESGIGPRLVGKPHFDGTEIAEAGPGLWVVRLEPEAALREYGTLVLHSKTAYRAVFDNRVSQGFFAAVPGLHQWAVLGKAWFHSQETDDADQKRFDTVVFDAPATGHGLEMLRVPKLLTDIAPAGPLRRDAELAWKMLSDDRRAGIVIVTLPEELAVSEALQLEGEVRSLALPVAVTVVNAASETLFDEDDAEALERTLEQNPSLAPMLDVALDRAHREQGEARQIARLRAESKAPVAVLPWCERAASGQPCPELVVAITSALGDESSAS